MSVLAPFTLIQLCLGAVVLLVVVVCLRPRRKPAVLSLDEKTLSHIEENPGKLPSLSPVPTMKEDRGLPSAPPPSSSIDPGAAKQTYDAFLEWPVCLLRWKHKDGNGRASRLETVDEFRSFVKPVWRPQLSSFCTELTGITQDNVDQAPTFNTLVHTTFRDFLVRNGLIDAVTNEPLCRFCWCSDGPWDIRDFVVKQCFISKMPLPRWISGDVMDVRRVVAKWQEKTDLRSKSKGSVAFSSPSGTFLPITRQLHLLGLGSFEGRQHCGMDVCILISKRFFHLILSTFYLEDTRNVARIVTELARRGMALRPNTSINPHRRWPWMGKNGKVLEEFVLPATPAL
ncbi:hypothetical protein NM688_g1912 [Phlebia brevispora]|uniref:Uncharacterized protein n=1 Tax=Phlebia brevispora TaxID=194682 RepID=A0ACC1TAD2_9APHY|nr:hypothetical protein NM688_g1912 [Phlebia brevispora]